MFDTIRRGAVTDAVRPGTTIEWDFADAAPWHVVLDNGSSHVSKATTAWLTEHARLIEHHQPNQIFEYYRGEHPLATSAVGMGLLTGKWIVPFPAR